MTRNLDRFRFNAIIRHILNHIAKKGKKKVAQKFKNWASLLRDLSHASVNFLRELSHAVLTTA